MINIVIPMAGEGRRFKEAGYSFPKPIIEIGGKTMIDVVVRNLKPAVEHKFIFVGLREHFETYDLHNILKKSTDNKFETVLLSGPTQGAACTVLSASSFINNDDELLIANADQFIKGGINAFIERARKETRDGSMVTFPSSHPKWSYARTDKNGKVLEVAEKKVISDHATAGVYYFKTGKSFVSHAQDMIHKNIRHDEQFFVAPVYNELILDDKKIFIDEVPIDSILGMGTPEDLKQFTDLVKEGKIKI